MEVVFILGLEVRRFSLSFSILVFQLFDYVFVKNLM